METTCLFALAWASPLQTFRAIAEWMQPNSTALVLHSVRFGCIGSALRDNTAKICGLDLTFLELNSGGRDMVTEELHLDPRSLQIIAVVLDAADSASPALNWLHGILQ